VADAQDVTVSAAAWLRRPGLVVVAGPPGSGRSTILRRTAALAPGPVHTGGGLAMLTAVPALALSRAVRARLPVHDVHLLAEAVRSRLRGALLVLDDIQYADPATLAALPHLAAHCRVLVALRTPHRLAADAEAALRDAATAWLDVPPLDRAAAADLVRRTAAHLDDAAVAAVVDRAGGNPLAITALARQAAAGRGAAPTDIDQVAYAIATALADLPRPARTALAALGLLGRPAPAPLLGPGATALVSAGLIVESPDGYQPVSTYLAETAAGLLDAPARAELHQRLAELTPPGEAARHLAAAGDYHAAFRRALAAADQASGGDRAALLLFACDLPDVTVDRRVRIAAADAALAAGRPQAAARVLTTAAPLGVEADVLRGEAMLQAGDPAGARAAVRPVPDAAAAPVVAARDRVLLLTELALDPHAAADTADKVAARYPSPPPGVAAAIAAVRAAHRAPGWDNALAAAASDTRDPLTSRWSAWLLVEQLAADGRLVESAEAAHAAARSCAADLAYGWHTRFAAAADWAIALYGAGPLPVPAGAAAGSGGFGRSPAGADGDSGAAGPDIASAGSVGAAPSPGGTGPSPPSPIGTVDDALRRAADLADRALPADARGYAIAAIALVEADTGLLAAARARLATGPDHPAAAWVAREAAWLDGQPDRAAQPPADTGADLLTGLHHITARWAAQDIGAAGPAAIPPGLPVAARRTLIAWATGTGFAAAADTWTAIALRERIRCLLAAGLFDADPQRAVDALLAAERLADAAGLTVLAGRARRALRRHRVHRDTRSPRSGTQLTNREYDVFRLVAAGEPTRRIAGQLGISAETVDTHIRAGMRKLGARTRTEAAALAFAVGEDGR
jgi:DNA-binding CsgD family transcriptional regulator